MGGGVDHCVETCRVHEREHFVGFGCRVVVMLMLVVMVMVMRIGLVFKRESFGDGKRLAAGVRASANGNTG